jgi:hypothetical protein
MLRLNVRRRSADCALQHYGFTALNGSISIRFSGCASGASGLMTIVLDRLGHTPPGDGLRVQGGDLAAFGMRRVSRDHV